jgi:hypothetical protein
VPGICCARVASGQVIAAPPRIAMNSRRFMLDPKLRQGIVSV